MTHNSHLPFRIMLVLAVLSAMMGLICFAQPVSQAAPAAIVQNNVTDARWLNLTTGPALAAPSGKITAVPLTLISANFNNDTLPDLLVGYETAVGGFLALYPGSEEEAHFALPHSFPVNFAPHWLAPGDFNTDGRQDIVAAAQGGTTLFFFAGDGRGGFHEPKPLALPGPLTALAAGDLHRQDGLADLAVGVAAAEGAQLLIYTGENGAQTAVPEIYPLPAPATNLAVEQLDPDGLFDVALTAGQTLLILHGRDQFTLEPSAPAALESFSLAFMPTSLALGNFLSGNALPVEIALPDSAGQIHLFSPTGEEVGGLETAVAGPARLLAADSSSLAGDDLFVMGEYGRQLQILTAGGQHQTSQGFSSPVADPGLLAALEAAAPFIAGLPLRLNDDALDDLVLLVDGAPQPLVMTTTAVNVFVITSRFDDPDKTPGDGLCKTNNGFCTLRAAIQEANASPGADDIVCGLDSYATNPIVQPDSPLPAITEAALLEGGARGTANCGKMEINGIAAGADGVDGLRLLGDSATIRNVAIYNFSGSGIFIDSSDNLVEENILGTNNSGTSLLSNHTGIYVADGQGNTIQHNIVSGNLMVGISVNGGSQTHIINGNSVGFWPSSPPKALPNLWGIAINGGLSNLIGSITAVNGGNFIAGNHYGGIDLAPESSFTTVQANYVGVTTVNTGLSNKMGIAMRGPSNTIGGSPTGHNTIAYNTDGIHLYNTPATNNRVSYNIIGGAAGNLGDGIWVSDNASQNQITNNEIGSNGRSGIYIQADGTTCAKNQVRNNLIGTDQSYTADQGNGVDGILVKGVSCTTISTNRIYFNDRHGIYINAAQPVTATIELNSIARNGDSGILLSTSNNVVEGNTTSFNGQIGIWVQGSYNQLTANKAYGDDLSGHYQITGIRIDGSHNTLIGGDLYAPQSEISDHHGSGLELKGSYNSVQNYYIHSNWDAGIDITGDNNVVGGAGNGRNIISVNFDGIRLAVGAANNQILGNYIGTDLTGVYDAGNIVGVQVYGGSNQIGGTAVNEGNRIAYSQGPNISLNGSSATGSIIENNIIGPTVVDGSPGIEITNSASGNTLRSNQISSSRGAGIAITSGTNNRLLSNILFGNSGLGIDLAPNGVTLNDTGDNDTGANQLQNFPVITTVTAGTSTRIQGTLSSKASTSYTLQFYANTACDTAGYGEGERLLGQTSVTTNSSGQAGFDVTLAVGNVLGQYITATAADSSGNTSEFSKCSVGRPVSSGVPFTVNTTSDAVDLNIGDGICDSSAVTGQQCTLRAAVQEANFSVGSDTIIIPAGTYALTLTGSDTAAAVGDLDITDALTISGAGADTTTVQGSMSDRIFEIRNNAAVSIAGITIRGGAPASSNNGGGILVNSGTSLALEGMTVRNNATVSGGGGGIYSSGTLNITNSAIVSNTTTLSAP
ncbi:MAG: right-handed parallel beta-helix repeat-containing protein [Ardenticatenaceae bacterium]|nr:right-handed parallel beta-helix repeat-containing protein [Ardenticatenaceae bacterium]